MKISITDKFLGKKYIHLSNGKKFYNRRSDVPLFSALTCILFILSLNITEFDLRIILLKFPQMKEIFVKIFHPKWQILPNIIPAIIETLQISLVGTIIGVALALPAAVFSSYNINSNRYLLFFSRIALSIVRSFPTIIIATILTLIFTTGSLAGVFAIAVFSFSTVTKMLIESIETLDMKAFESMQSIGASKFQSFWIACLPQLLSTYVSHALYSFEINVRTASILGYVGAGGIGILMNEKISWRDYNALGSILFTLFAIVLLINTVAMYFRKKYENSGKKYAK